MAREKLILALLLVTASSCHLHIYSVQAKRCHPDGLVYGENGFVDEILSCSLSQTFDLDLTPSGDHSKLTPKTLVEMGLSNRTSILHARLSGIWTARRPELFETGWQCEPDQVTSSTLIELSGLSLEVVERLEAPMSRNQQKLSIHKPCKTFDVPAWMCRQTKPVYRTTSTWVNRAYFNLTLTQNKGQSRATIAHLGSMFTCPETFRQRVTHSPSSTYILSRHSHELDNSKAPSKTSTHVKRDSTMKQVHKLNEIPSLESHQHQNSFTSSPSSNMPISPLYHNSVRVITNEVTRVLRAAIESCIDSLEVDLSLVRDYVSFKEHKYNSNTKDSRGATRLGLDEENAQLRDSLQSGIANECSNELWIKRRVELANQASSLADETVPTSRDKPSKRDQLGLKQAAPDELNELLNPYGFYHDAGADQMID